MNARVLAGIGVLILGLGGAYAYYTSSASPSGLEDVPTEVVEAPAENEVDAEQVYADLDKVDAATETLTAAWNAASQRTTDCACFTLSEVARVVNPALSRSSITKICALLSFSPLAAAKHIGVKQSALVLGCKRV